MPDLPNIHALIVLALTVFTLFLFTRDSIPLETSSLLILILLVVIFQLFPYELDGAGLKATDFFAGFGHEALITIAALMIVGKGLETTGALQPLAVKMALAWVKRPKPTVTEPAPNENYPSPFANRSDSNRSSSIVVDVQHFVGAIGNDVANLSGRLLKP